MKVYISKNIISEEAHKLAEDLKGLRAEIVEIEKRLKRERRAFSSDAVLLQSAKKNLSLIKGKQPGMEAQYKDQIRRAQAAIDRWNALHKPQIEELESTLSKLREESVKLEESLDNYYELDVNVVQS